MPNSTGTARRPEVVMVRREEKKVLEPVVSVVEDVKDVVIETTNAATAKLDCSSCSAGSMLNLVVGAGACLVLAAGFIMTLMLIASPTQPMICPAHFKTVQPDTNIREVPPVFYFDNGGNCEGPYMTTYNGNGTPGVMGFNGAEVLHALCQVDGTLLECNWP